MSFAIESIALTPGQVFVLEAATTCNVGVAGGDLLIARALERKGLGAISCDLNGARSFKINEAGRDQLRIRQ